MAINASVDWPVTTPAATKAPALEPSSTGGGWSTEDARALAAARPSAVE